MTNPSRKRVPTLDDLNVLNQNAAYARQKGEAAETAATRATTAAEQAEQAASALPSAAEAAGYVGDAREAASYLAPLAAAKTQADQNHTRATQDHQQVTDSLAAVDQSILRADAAAARVEADVDRTFEEVAWGVADETGRAALSIDLNGDTTVYGALTAAGATQEAADGVAWAIADITGRMALYVDDQGVTHGTFVDMSAMTLPLPTRDITAWGDSMTEGAGTPNFEGAWLTQLATRHPELMAGRTLRKRGIIGQTAEQIAARAGGWTVRLRIPQPIPASGPSAGIWITTAVGDVNRTEPHCREFRGRVAGIPGTLRLADDGTYTWERDTPGAPIPVPAEGVVWTPDVDWRATVVLWAGRNGPDRVSTFAEIRSVTDRLLTQVAAPRYLVLSVVNAADEPNGHPTNNVIQALNIRLMELYGDRYVDVRGAVTAGRADGTPDPQYMAPDGLHFNATGYALVADLVAAALTAKGW